MCEADVKIVQSQGIIHRSIEMHCAGMEKFCILIMVLWSEIITSDVGILPNAYGLYPTHS
jgi:hypothetical protein